MKSLNETEVGILQNQKQGSGNSRVVSTKGLVYTETALFYLK